MTYLKILQIFPWFVVWGSDLVHQTVNSIQDPYEVIDFNRPDSLDIHPMV